MHPPVESGNDRNNKNSYGTVAGQRGCRYLPWSPGKVGYFSNVGDHAMGTAYRNSNMAKIAYYN